MDGGTEKRYVGLVSIPSSLESVAEQRPPETVERTLAFDDASTANALFGPQNAHLRIIADELGIHAGTCGLTLTITGNQAAAEVASSLVVQLYGLLKGGHTLHSRDFSYASGMLRRDPSVNLGKIFRDAVFVVSPRRNITPKTLSQRDYVAALREADMTFAVGPAGTGKTYLAVAVALSLLLAKRVKRIILTRPAVEAGERLGFLPGDLAQKINPYLRPLYDALFDMFGSETYDRYLERGMIEVAPLAYMRGRTLDDSFIILDEAQNTTPEQMKMFLTRLGFGSKAVITGDLTQIDLPDGKRSGLTEAVEILSGIEEIGITRLTSKDVVRHPLIQKIIAAYDKKSNNNYRKPGYKGKKRVVMKRNRFDKQ